MDQRGQRRVVRVRGHGSKARGRGVCKRGGGAAARGEKRAQVSNKIWAKLLTMSSVMACPLERQSKGPAHS